MTEAKIVWKASEERNSGPLFPSVRAGNDSSHNNMRFLIMAFAPEPRGMPIYRDWPSVPQSRPPLSPKKASGDPLYFIVNILFLTVENVNDMKTNNEGARRFFANCANAFRFHSQFFLIFVLLSPLFFLLFQRNDYQGACLLFPTWSKIYARGSYRRSKSDWELQNGESNISLWRNEKGPSFGISNYS